jgi:molybdenum cofactor biosynthesis enzyme MoaA
MFNQIFFDITERCNLRCPYCSFDWSTIKKAEFAPMSVVSKIIELAPFVEDSCVSLSCEHEPTLHPKFIEIINFIPLHLRKKFFLTTNLVSKFVDENMIRSVLNSGISQLNISVDTLSADLYPKLRVGGEYGRFMRNLETIKKVKKDINSDVKIQAITVAMRSNFSELESIVAFTKDMCMDVHEIRYMFDIPHIPRSLFCESILTEENWKEIVEKFSNDPRVNVLAPTKDYYERNLQYFAEGSGAKNNTTSMHIASESEAKVGWRDIVLNEYSVNGLIKNIEKKPETVPVTLFVKPNGAAFIGEIGKHEFQVNLLSLNSPAIFFLGLLGKADDIKPIERFLACDNSVPADIFMEKMRDINIPIPADFSLSLLGAEGPWNDLSFQTDFLVTTSDQFAVIISLDGKEKLPLRIVFRDEDGDCGELWREYIQGVSVFKFSGSDILDGREGAKPVQVRKILFGGDSRGASVRFGIFKNGISIK